MNTLALLAYYSLDLQKLHSKHKLDLSNNRGASFQKQHVGARIDVTTCSYEVFAGIKAKLAEERSAISRLSHINKASVDRAGLNY